MQTPSSKTNRAPDRPTPARPASAQPTPAQRSRGEASLRVGLASDGTSRVTDLFQAGAARLRMPRALPHLREPLECIAVNTSGGLTGGDVVQLGAGVDDGAAASLTSQACERIYRSSGGAARVRLNLRVGPGATLLWWPQETIVFEGGALSRDLTAEVAPDATLLVVEAMVFGRAAMGERMERAFIRDRWRVTRPDGRLFHAEALRIDGRADLAGPAAMNGAGAIASVLLVAPDAERHLKAARTCLGGDGAASCWGGRLLARIVAEDGYALRRRLVPLAERLAGRPVPRGWSL